MDDDAAKADEAVAEPPAGEPDFQLGSFAAEPEHRNTLTRGLDQGIDRLDDGGPGGAKAAHRRASPQQRLEQLTRKLFPGGIKQG